MIYLFGVTSLFLFISWLLYSRIKIKIDDIMLLLLILSEFLFSKFYDITYSFELFIISVLVFLFMALIVLIFFFRNYKEAFKNKFNKIIVLFFTFWVIYGCVQYLVSYNRSYIPILAFIINVFLVLAVIFYTNSIKNLKKMYQIWFAISLLLIVIGWWEVITDNHLSTSGALEYNKRLGHIATAIFFNPNDFAYYLIVSTPVMFYMLLRKNIILKLIGCFMFVSSVYFIYLIAARMIMILIAISIVGLFFYLLKQKKIGTLFALLTFLIIFVSLCYPFIQDGIARASTLNTLTDESTILRQNLAIGGLKIFMDHPLGVGSGNLELYMPFYTDNVLGLTDAHNFWIELLANYGFIIFSIFISLFIFSFVRMWTAFKQNKELRPLILPVILSLILFIPACIESSTAFQIRFTWLFIGIYFSSVKVFREHQKLSKV